jgi:hypothetical protein
MTGTSTITAQAPCQNFVTAITTSSTAVANAPSALTARPSRHPGSLILRWRFAMPAWVRVNDVNTPIA